MYQSEEVCCTCKHAGSGDGGFMCLNEKSPEYLEEKRWGENCDFWEANNEN